MKTLLNFGWTLKTYQNPGCPRIGLPPTVTHLYEYQHCSTESLEKLFDYAGYMYHVKDHVIGSSSRYVIEIHPVTEKLTIRHFDGPMPDDAMAVLTGVFVSCSMQDYEFARDREYKVFEYNTYKEVLAERETPTE